MFNIEDIFGWIGNVAVFKDYDGVWLVDSLTGEKRFVPERMEAEENDR